MTNTTNCPQSQPNVCRKPSAITSSVRDREHKKRKSREEKRKRHSPALALGQESEMCRGITPSCWLLAMLSLKGVFAGDWSVQLQSSPICAVIGSSVVLPCSYDYPQSSNENKTGGQPAQGGGGDGQQYKVLSEMWCLKDSRCITQRYLYHSAGIFLDPSYQKRVQYHGQLGSKNCSLRISDLRQSDSGTYVFYLITDHPTEKMPQQRGVQLLVSDSLSTVTVSASPSSDITDCETLRLACCSPSAGPAALFRWYKSTSTTPRHTGQVWSIDEVTSNDSGNYWCQIETGDKSQNSSVLAIDVQYSPRNTTISVSPPVEFQGNLTVTLTCSSDANPPVHTYTWYQGEACLLTADKSFHRARQSPGTPAGRNATLSRASITAEEYGQHCCVARNAHGSQTYSVTVRDSRATKSAGSRAVLSGVLISIVLVISAVVGFVMMRRHKSSTTQSYVPTQTTATEP